MLITISLKYKSLYISIHISYSMFSEASTQDNQDKVFQVLFKEDEVTWKTIIMDLIRTEGMDPWDINLSHLAEEFLKTLKAMKELDFRISGKIILAAAFFLKIKSDKLLNEDLSMLDDIMLPQEELDEFIDELPIEEEIAPEKPKLRHKTPRPRKRKVSVYDLIGSLEKALENSYKKSIRTVNTTKMEAPKKQKDMSHIITELYDNIQKSLSKISSLKFHELLASDDKQEKVDTFIPLLHLDQKKIELEQEEHFGDIDIKLAEIKSDYAAN